MSRHSNDLRIRVIGFYNKGNTISETSKIFNISRSTIRFWINLFKTDSLYRIIPRVKMSKLDDKEILNFIDNNSDLYNYEIAKEFNTSKESIRKSFVKVVFIFLKNNKTSFNS